MYHDFATKQDISTISISRNVCRISDHFFLNESISIRHVIDVGFDAECNHGRVFSYGDVISHTAERIVFLMKGRT